MSSTDLSSRKDFFIIYTKPDEPWAKWIAWALEAEGYTTVIQAWDFRPGHNFVLEMQEADANTQQTMPILSSHFLSAPFTQPEWAAAFAQDPTGRERGLIPVRVTACKPTGLLAPIIYIDLVDLSDEEAAKQTLLAGVRVGRAKPATPPRFPGATATLTEKPRFPGALPPIWNVPYHRNPNFTGRDPLLASLRAALTSGQFAALTQAIHGLGGVGKTQIATEYAYRHATDYSLVWWLPAEEPAALSASYAALAQPLNLPEQGHADQRVVNAAVRERLARHGGWLLVFDNAPGPEALQNYRPQGQAGHVLVTSQNPNWGDLCRPLPVPRFLRADSVAFLLRRTGKDDAASAALVAEALGDFPLALAQAAAYMEQTCTTLTRYLELFQEYQQELLASRPTTAGYDHTVATTWELAFRQLSPAAAGLLQLCAFLAPNDIYRELLEGGKDDLPEPLAACVAHPLQFAEALAALRRYSLVEGDGDVWNVHRLVQAVVRQRLKPEERKTWAGAAARVVNAVFPEDSHDVRTWTVCARLLPHALAAAEQAEGLEVAPEAAGRLLNQAGLYLRGRAEFRQATNLHQRALAIGEKTYGKDSHQIALFLNNLGSALRDQGLWTEARDNFQRSGVV